ncbi:MAG: ABC transporter substrate binding protein [Sedimenticola sp.]
MNNIPARLIRIALIALTALFSLSIQADHSKDSKRIILVQTMPVLPVLNHSRTFIEHLEQMGYVNGQNLDLVILQPDGDRGRAEAMLQETLYQGQADLVVTSATMASQVAHKILRGTATPQLFFTVSDPVGAGLVRALGVTGDDKITGKVHSVDRAAKIELLLRLLGSKHAGAPLRLGLIYSSYPSSVGDAKLLAEAAKKFDNLVFVPHRIPYHPVPDGLPEMLDDATGAIEQLDEKVDYWWEPSGPLGERDEFSRLLRDKSKRPVVFGTNMMSVKLGALLHVTPNDNATGMEAARLAVAILEGAHAGNFPVTAATDFDLGINLATALEMGIAIPSDLAELAGPNIFREIAP